MPCEIKTKWESRRASIGDIRGDLMGFNAISAGPRRVRKILQNVLPLVITESVLGTSTLMGETGRHMIKGCQMGIM